ncbi:hypothetical protein M3I53_32050 [Paraburkholderia sp. CNPSo 3272]|uniref:hypothetical protein n=1 Tax=Paraburkholderia sp. CNPSo 3272 TaxID=2940931 RepID=UPI0020B68618|nr:hypothetical protein [Paraburkholderia sp. CNPSo 3272]MCP3727703.1 hypothetical protein [Paraburkholderia sp. CNPSo 3272]
MHRVFSHRGFEIHVRLTEASRGLYDATFWITGNENPGVVEELGAETKLRKGPLTLERALEIAEKAGQAAIDAVLGEDGS